MHILFLFIDGIGLGRSDAKSNPFARLSLPAFESLAGGQPWLRRTDEVDAKDHLFRAVDPTLEIEGLPQSGTGQATLFTGVNCARVVGRHYGPYPHSETRPIIARHNLFRRIEALAPEAPEPVAFANAYPLRFFEYVDKTDRWTVTTRCCLESGARIRDRTDLARGLALPADLIGKKWPEPLENGMMPKDETDAAYRLTHIATHHRLTLFEYFLTDKAGHQQSADQADAVLRSLDRLFDGLLHALDFSTTLLVITSDHGNLEDLSVKTHTRNDVPFVAFGTSAGRLNGVRRLDDVTPALVSLLGESSA